MVKIGRAKIAQVADGQFAQCLALIETSAYAHVDHVGEKIAHKQKH